MNLFRRSPRFILDTYTTLVNVSLASNHSNVKLNFSHPLKLQNASDALDQYYFTMLNGPRDILRLENTRQNEARVFLNFAPPRNNKNSDAQENEMFVAANEWRTRKKVAVARILIRFLYPNIPVVVGPRFEKEAFELRLESVQPYKTLMRVKAK